MLSKTLLAALLATAATAIVVDPPSCLTPAQAAALTPSGTFALQARQFPKYVLTSQGYELAKTADPDNSYWELATDSTLTNIDGEEVYAGTLANGYRVGFGTPGPDPEVDVKCCVVGLGKVLRCGYDGTMTTGGQAWVNSDGTLSLGPAAAKPVDAKAVSFVVRKKV